MRKLLLFMMVSLDGYFEGPNHSLDWHNVDKEFNEFAINQLGEADTLVFGRVTYQMMESWWTTPTAMKDDPIVANSMNSAAKIVFSRTLKRAGWNNTRLIKDDAAKEMAKLKKQPGKAMAILGSSNLCTSLIKAGLIDEFRIMINPVAIGKGTTLFKGMEGRLKLKLTKTRVFKSGNVLLYYKPEGR